MITTIVDLALVLLAAGSSGVVMANVVGILTYDERAAWVSFCAFTIVVGLRFLSALGYFG